MKLIWAPLAIEKVTQIAQYIALDNTSASIKWVENIFKRSEQIKNFPESGRVVPEVGRKNIREIIYGNYRIIYKIQKKETSILTIQHTKQILPIDEIK
ncbi:hypothetical protein ES703_81262 [subsurface metagenome]